MVLRTLRRQAKADGNFFVEPEAKLLFVVRIVGILKMSPKPRKVLQLLRLRQLHNGVFLKVNKPILQMLKLINPFVAYGYPSLKTVRELVYKRGFGKVNKQRIPLADNEIITKQLGEHGIYGMEDLIHEIYTVGPSIRHALGLGEASCPGGDGVYEWNILINKATFSKQRINFLKQVIFSNENIVFRNK